MDRRATPANRVTSPTWGPLPPCKRSIGCISGDFYPFDKEPIGRLVVVVVFAFVVVVFDCCLDQRCRLLP